MEKAFELKQDKNRGIVKLQLEIPVELEAQHHLLLLVSSDALLFQLVAKITVKTESNKHFRASSQRSITTMNMKIYIQLYELVVDHSVSKTLPSVHILKYMDRNWEKNKTINTHLHKYSTNIEHLLMISLYLVFIGGKTQLDIMVRGNNE